MVVCKILVVVVCVQSYLATSHVPQDANIIAANVEQLLFPHLKASEPVSLGACRNSRKT